MRDAVGDEFVELFNPHDKAIDLAGVVITSRRADPRNPGSKKGVSFVFPPATLGPGQCAVVFNGRNAKWDGPVGDTSRAPQAPHPLFYDAYVFTARCSGRVTFANGGDWVMLVAPSGERVQVVSWGSPKSKVPINVATIEHVGRVSSMSVQRESATGELVKHADLDGRLYSPGEAFVVKPEPGSDPPCPSDPTTSVRPHDFFQSPRRKPGVPCVL